MPDKSLESDSDRRAENHSEGRAETLLEAKSLSVSRGELQLFADRSFTITKGELVQLHGDNGSGKTTLLRALCTLMPLDEGELYWRGEQLPAARDSYFSEMAFAGHADGLKTGLTPVENLKWCLIDTPPDEDACYQTLAQTGLAGKEDLPCRVLSAGQRRRVVLARLLISKAVLWILDEPLTALDVSGRELVASLIEAHIEQGGSVIYSTHQPLPLSSRSADQTLMLPG